MGGTNAAGAVPTSQPKSVQPWTNTLGMKFVPVTGTAVLFGVWDVRVADFEAFVKASGHDATAGMYSLKKGEFGKHGDTWRSPGFSQGATHPVVGVSWNDAQAFCAWLTQRERAEGKLSADQSYRLPTEAEWNQAVGNTKYPWGEQWPPPSGAGNYAGSEAKDTDWDSAGDTITGYRDAYARTSPVGSYAANRQGLFDMGGNVWQWSEDWYDGKQKLRVFRGASWYYGGPDYVVSSYRNGDAPDVRRSDIGFRCVVASGSSRSAQNVVGAIPASQPKTAQPWTNTLGMKFVPVTGTAVLFGVWDVRVADFEVFVKASGHDATAGMYSLKKGEFGKHGDTWRSPGFSQGATHPVVGVSWNDAQAFCAWLTKKEQAEGKISADQSYRLPREVEWNQAVGNTKYPWGEQWPPPSGAGNYAGSEAKNADWPSAWSTIEGYRDTYARTSPVGSFAANRQGLFDMGGNVWQWCEDWYDGKQEARVLRGASWGSRNPVRLVSSFRFDYSPVFRDDGIGFRCVLASGSSRSAGQP